MDESTFSLWLQEVESVDYWGPTFRAIYESGAQGEFLERLEARIEEHDAEIEKMCNHHYQGFIASVRELLHVREDAAALNADVVAVDRAARDSASSVAARGHDLVRARRVEKNMAATIESLSVCLPVLQTFTKLSRQMGERRYHPALKTLEQLEHTHLPRIANYRFSKHMRETVPRLRESIKDASMRELNDFLEEVRQTSPKIGEAAMRRAAARLKVDPALLGEVDPTKGSQGGEDEEEDLSAEDLVDFSPVYKCLHIYSVLGERDEFEQYYRKQRRQQASLTLQPPGNMHESIEGYLAFFYGIVGFFVCEDHVLNTGNGLVSRGHLDEVWSMASSRIMSTLQTRSSYCIDSSFMLKMKNLMLLFSHTLQGYGFGAEKMYGLLQELRDHYNEVLMQKWVLRFRHIFDSDNYHPVQVNTRQEFEEVLESIPFAGQNLEEAPFPRHFPFSAMVPKVYQELKDFVDACVQFLEDLNMGPAEVDETVRRSTNVLLGRTLSGCLSSLILRDNLSLIQLIQIDINTYHLEETNFHLEKYISGITGTSIEATHIARLQGRSIFKDIRAEAEGEIHRKLISKIDEFIELANYDWLMAEPSGTPSSWLMDLIAFLKSVFLSFTNLPLKLAQATCMSACQHLSKSLMNMFMADGVKALTLGALQQIDLDLVQCEQFAASEPIQGLEEGVLLLCFSDLRQLLDLFVAWDWSTYLADYGQEKSKYLRVQPQNALAILDKLKESEKKNNMFAIMNKKDKDKRRLVETIHKQLKALVTKNNDS